MKKIVLIMASLFLMGMAMAQSGNHWSPITGTQYNMTVKGIIVIDGMTQTSNQLEIGAFCGDECRGSRKAALFPPTGEYPVMLTVVSNVFSGEAITFRIYDHASQQELNLTSESTLTFEHNTNQGAMNNWFPFVFTSPSQTFTLPITGYGTSTGGYNLIAPPIDDVAPATVGGMTEGDYDLYYFDQGEDQEWRNYKANPFNLESGKGYLYAHSTDITLTFTGTPYSGNGQVTLSRAEGVEFAGWNLVGNPFPQTAYIGGRDFYVMNPEGSEIIAAETASIAAMQGVFVVAAEDGETLTFSTENSVGDSPRLVLNVQQGRSAAIDRAIVRFGGASVLPKFMLNQGNTKLYIPHDGSDYAVMTADSGNTTPVSFKAQRNGSYTLSVDIYNLDMDYLHLVDNQTGADVDLLQTPNYTFEARTTDYANRFRLVYAVDTGIEENVTAFAFVIDGDIVVTEASEEAVLQIVDLTGRVIVSDCGGTRCVPTAGMVPGVYVLRLIDGKDVRTQKMVIPSPVGTTDQ